jgi:PAS domain S-box-containing protein
VEFRNGVRVAIVDVTAEHFAEEALRRNEARFRALIENSAETVSLLEATGTIRYQSANVTTMLGYQAAEMEGRNAFDFVHPDDLAPTRALFAEVLAEPNRLRQTVARVRHRNGAWRWLQFTGKNLLHDPAVAGVVLNTRDITKEQEALIAVRESEERFRTMADGAPVLIWLADTNKRCTWFNQPWCDFVGRTLEHELGDGWAANVHPDDLEMCRKTYSEAFDAREEFKMEYRLRRHDGVWRWVLDHGIPLYGPGQVFTGYIGSCVDITEQRNVRQELAEQARLLDLSNDAIIVRDPEGQILYWNHGAEELYGYTRGEAVGQLLATLLLPEFSKPLESIMDELYRDGRWDGEAQVRRRDGQLITVATRWALDRNPAGRRGAILHTDNDITARKHAEEKLRYQLQLVSNITEKAASCIFLTDEQHRITLANPQAEHIFGYTARELEGRELHKILRRHFPGELPYAEGETPIVDIQNSRTNMRDRQEVFLHKDGTPLIMECSTAPLEVGGRRVGAIFMMRDVTERMRSEEAMRHAHEQLETRVVQRTEQLARAHEQLRRQITERAQLQEQILVAGDHERTAVAQDLHDSLCPMLLGIRFKVELLRRRQQKKAQPDVKRLGAISRLLGRAIEDARGLARGLHPVESGPDGLMLALEQLAISTRKIFRVTCHYEVPALVRVTDTEVATQLFRIAQEAVTNAIKHGKAASITIRLTQDDNQLELAVSNNGRPVKRQAGPHGLGLRTMEYRATQIGATIELKSEPNNHVVLRCVRPVRTDKSKQKE